MHCIVCMVNIQDERASLFHSITIPSQVEKTLMCVLHAKHAGGSFPDATAGHMVFHPSGPRSRGNILAVRCYL